MTTVPINVENDLAAQKENADNGIHWFRFVLPIPRTPAGAERDHTTEMTDIPLAGGGDDLPVFEGIAGSSHRLRAELARVEKVAQTDATVLITGESGTGKELIAQAIHKRSRRAGRPFIGVNCAALSRELVASELFGHERGAFTGALQQRLGRFEQAQGGTIFLDEVGELPAETQVALLRVLQEREFERVGGNRAIRSDVRIVAATNRDLPQAIHEGRFRSDLYYRMNVFPIELPPLRERGGDLRHLVSYFVNRHAERLGKTIRRIDGKSLERLCSYAWPGNIRELQNVIERSMILCDTECFVVDGSWAPEGVRSSRSTPQEFLSLEKQMIEAALAEASGRITGRGGAADKLRMRPSSLSSRIRALNVNKDYFKPLYGIRAKYSVAEKEKS